MSINPSNQFGKDLIGALSMQEYKALLVENLSSQKQYLDTGHLQPEIISTADRWFKGSKDRGFRGQLAS